MKTVQRRFFLRGIRRVVQLPDAQHPSTTQELQPGHRHGSEPSIRPMSLKLNKAVEGFVGPRIVPFCAEFRSASRKDTDPFVGPYAKIRDTWTFHEKCGLILDELGRLLGLRRRAITCTMGATPLIARLGKTAS